MIGLKQEFWWGGGVSRNHGDVGMKTTTFFLSTSGFTNIFLKKKESKTCSKLGVVCLS